MTFEGQSIQGAPKILEKLQVRRVAFPIPIDPVNFRLLQSLTFQKINRIITAIDSQPMFDGGVLINVLGRLQVSLSRCLLNCNLMELLSYLVRLTVIRHMLTLKPSFLSQLRIVFSFNTISFDSPSTIWRETSQLPPRSPQTLFNL